MLQEHEVTTLDLRRAGPPWDGQDHVFRGPPHGGPARRRYKAITSTVPHEATKGLSFVPVSGADYQSYLRLRMKGGGGETVDTHQKKKTNSFVPKGATKQTKKN